MYIKQSQFLSKRSNQINIEMKEELNQKLDEFATSTDNLEEIFENREQIEVSRYYERLPKSGAIAIQELEQEKYFGKLPKLGILFKIGTFMLSGKNVLLAIAGSIAAYKSAYLVRDFIKRGANVKVIITDSALQFVTPVTLSTLSKNPAYKIF